MKEIVYTFNSRGCYLPDKTTEFGTETHMKLIIKPHEFELKISDEILRKSSCEEYIIEVSCRGEVRFYDSENNLLAKTDEAQADFSEVRFSWKQNLLLLNFGHTETVDHYPNCDGEHDRWGTEWVSDRTISFNTTTNQTKE